MGLLLTLVGIVIGVIPFIGIIGVILAIIGVILIILGRHAFGGRHSTFVRASIALWFVGFIGGIVLLASVPSAIRSALSNPDPASITHAVSGVFNGIFIGAIMISIIAGLDNVFLTYQLQARKGRLLLWAGYVGTLLVGITIFVVVSQEVPAAITQTLASHDSAPLLQLQSDIRGLGLLNIFPALIFATAYYMAWSRIENGDIPKTAPLTPSPLPASGDHIQSWPVRLLNGEERALSDGNPRSSQLHAHCQDTMS